MPYEEAIYASYHTPPVAVFLKELTPQGLVQYMNDTTLTKLGAGVIVNSEVGDEFNNNANFPDLIKLLSEAYDLGILEATYTKGKDFRNDGVSGVAINALYIGSQAMILFNESIKAKFVSSFMSKLSRRTFFCYSPEIMPEEDFSQEPNPTRAMYEATIVRKQQAKDTRNRLADKILSITSTTLKDPTTTLTLTPDADYLLEVLKRYDYEIGIHECNPDSITSFAIRNRYWKVLKLAGSLAILDSSSTIKEQHIIGALNISELFSHDLGEFEKDLNKAPHERLSDYIRTLVTVDNKALLSVHEIKKHGFTPTVSLPKLKELVHLCVGYDQSGIYSIINEGGAIQYEPIIKTDTLVVSFKDVDMTRLNAAVVTGDKEAIDLAKHAIASTTAYGFEAEEVTFEELGELLLGDFAYSPFRFRNGTRNKNNIMGGAKFVVFDIDQSLVTASEIHFMLSDINHHIALSSDPSNEYKFRLLIELDSVVETTSQVWKFFFLAIAQDLALVVDPLPQSQIFFSYADRPVLSVTDAEPLEVRNYLIQAIDKSTTKEAERKLTPAQKSLQLTDPLETFFYLYETKQGARSRNMHKMMLHARDLGANYSFVSNLMDEVNTYWESDCNSISQNELDKLKQQAYSILGD